MKIITKVIIKDMISNRSPLHPLGCLNNIKKGGSGVGKPPGRLNGRTDLGGFKYSLMVFERKVFPPPHPSRLMFRKGGRPFKSIIDP